MSEYIPKYPSEEGDDSNKTSSELLAETLKPIYVPQDLMLAWESHLASYSRDTHELLEQVKESEDALNAKYQALLARVQKYEQMLQDITMDSNEFTMDTDVVNFTGWNILAQASYWDYLLRKEITKLRDQIKSAEFKGELVTDVSNSVLENLATGNQHITNIIGALTDSPLIRDLDTALSGTSNSLSELRRQHEALKAKQYADALALADQNGQTFDQLTLTFNNLISEQIDRIADEAATRTRVFEELEDGLTVESQLRQEGQEVIATQVSTLKASTETSLAGIRKEYSTIAGTNEAITTALNTYSAKVDGTIATILTDYVAYANLDSALTSKSDKLLAIVNDNIGKLNITNEIQAGLTSIKALSTVSVDLNGVVSGYGLISELENGIVKSAFGVNADTFYIGKPTDKVKPFVVTSVPKNIDGIDFPAGTWINSAIIANATIGTAHIKDASITNAKIKELDASKITTGTLDAKRIRVGSTTQFDSGYAPSDVYNNAKSYVDRTTGNLVNNPSVSENTIRWSTGTVTDQPFLGTTIPALTLTTSGDLMTISDKIDVDPAKAYEVSVWVKKSAAVGSTYLGLTLGNALGETIQVNAVTQSGGSSLTSNFYHWNVAAAANPLDWQKLVAYVMPAGTNPSDMKNVGTVTSNAIMLTNSRKLQMRLLNYYNGGTTTSVWFANPKIVEVDPNAVIAAAKAQILADSKTQTFTVQPTTPYSTGDIYRNGASIYVCTTARASGSYVASDWTLVGDVTANNTAADSNKLGGTAASTVLDNAAKGLSVYNDVMSDLKITPVEKTALNTEWVRVQAEYTSMLSHATSLGVATTSFTSAYTALSTTSPSMSSILSSMTTTTTLTSAQRDALRTQFTNYYVQVTALDTAINEKIAANAKAQADAKSVTFTAQPTIPYSKGDLWKDGSTIKVTTVTRTSGSYTAADWILVGDVTSNNTAADTAAVGGISAVTVRENAAKGLKVHDDVMSDLIITPVEKTFLNTEWNRIKAEYANLISQASGLGIPATTLTNAYTAVNTTAPSMTTILSSMVTSTTLTTTERNNFRTQLDTYYKQAVAMTKSIADKIAANAMAYTDAVEVGGRNYALNSASGNTSKTLSPSWDLIAFAGRAVTISFDIDMTTAATSVQTGKDRIGFEFSYVDTGGTSRYVGAWCTGVFAKGVFKERVVNTYVLPTSPSKTAVTALSYHYQVNGGVCRISNVKVEVGNKATDWSPAPEDVDTAIESKSKTFITTPTTPYTSGDIFRNGSAIYVCTNPRASGSYTASDWTLAGDVTANNTAADTAKVNGVSAATVVLNAANGAAVYADVMSDLKITPVEKTAINQEWNRIQKEYTSLLAQAQGLGLSTTAYTSAYTGLSTTDPAMSTILASMSTTTTLTAAQRDAYKTQYTTYYTQAVAITKAINDKIAANAKAQADAKSKTFTAQPAPPYTAGDLWKDGSTIRVCTVTRASGSYVAADWTLVGDVTSANTAANSNQLGGKAASTVLGDITNAKNSADAATTQLTLWKYPNTTEIDGGKIRTNTVTANQIQVDSLSALSAKIGTLTSTTSAGTFTLTSTGFKLLNSAGKVIIELGLDLK